MCKKINIKRIILVIVFAFTSLFSAYISTSALTLTETQLAPGITYSKTTKSINKKNVNLFIARMDLAVPGVSINALVDAPINGSQTVMSFAKQYDNFSAINASFCSWELTGFEVRGPIVQSYKLLESSSNFNVTSNVYACIYKKKGTVPKISYLHPYLYLRRADGKTAKVESYNTDFQGQSTLALFDRNFSSSSIGNSTFGGICELVVTNGIMTELRYGLAKTTIPTNGFVVSSTGSGATLLSQIYKNGVALKFDALANGTPTPATIPAGTSPAPVVRLTDFEYCVPGGAVVLNNGIIPTTFSHVSYGSASDLQPRSCVGISKDGKQVFFVVADGRSTTSAGMSLTSLGNFMKELGAWSAMNLDGGASSTLVTKGGGGYFYTKNVPSERDKNGNATRSIPVALGANYIVPTPSPIPTSSPVPTPTPTPSPVPTPTKVPTPTPKPTVKPTPPKITISNYIKTYTNKSFTVTAKTDKGKLNASSHTFIANDSFTFIAKASDGSFSRKTVVIKNIDKTLPVIHVIGFEEKKILNDSEAKGSVRIVIREANLMSKTIKKNGKTISWPKTNKLQIKGKYVITAVDKASNKRIFSFTIS